MHPGFIGLFSKSILKIDYIPDMKSVGKDSYLDLNKKELVINLETNFDKPSSTSIVANVTSRHLKSPLEGVYGGFKADRAQFVMPKMSGPMFATFKLVLQDQASAGQKEPNSWKLTIPRSILP